MGGEPVVAIAPAQLGDDCVRRGRDLCRRRGAGSGLCACSLRALGRCRSRSRLGRGIGADVGLLLRLAHEAQGIDREGQLHPDGQRERLQGLRGGREGLLHPRVLPGHGACMDLAEPGGPIPQGGQLPGHVDPVQRDHQRAAGVAVRIGAGAGVHQPLDVSPVAHGARYAFGLQGHGGRQVALHDAHHGGEGLIPRRPGPQSAECQCQQHDSPQQGPETPAHGAACRAPCTLPAGGGHGACGSGGWLWRGGWRLPGGGRQGRLRIGRGWEIGGRHQNVNPRLRCRRSLWV